MMPRIKRGLLKLDSKVLFEVVVTSNGDINLILVTTSEIIILGLLNIESQLDFLGSCKNWLKPYIQTVNSSFACLNS